MRTKYFSFVYLMWTALIAAVSFAILTWGENRKLPLEGGKNIVVIDDRLRLEFSGRGEKTVGDFLAGENIVLSEADRVLPLPEQTLFPGTRIVITRARFATIQVDGEEQPVLSQARTVEELLSEAEIRLEDDDILEPGRE